MMMMDQEVENINKEMEIIKIHQIEFQVLKSAIIEMKNHQNSSMEDLRLQKKVSANLNWISKDDLIFNIIKNKQSLRHILDNMKHTNICVKEHQKMRKKHMKA